MTQHFSFQRQPMRRVGATIGVLALALSLAACAPEPETGEDVHGKNPIEAGEATYPEAPDEAYDKTVKLPESFPVDAFPIPQDAVIDNTGEGGVGGWFVVFLADDTAAAEKLWQQLVDGGGFSVEDHGETTEGGRTATLTSGLLAVEATTIPQSDGTVLLSYDLVDIAV